jgi:hypothetical protein
MNELYTIYMWIPYMVNKNSLPYKTSALNLFAKIYMYNMNLLKAEMTDQFLLYGMVKCGNTSVAMDTTTIAMTALYDALIPCCMVLGLH